MKFINVLILVLAMMIGSFAATTTFNFGALQKGAWITQDQTTGDIECPTAFEFQAHIEGFTDNKVLLQWDLSSLPDSATINSASLHVQNRIAATGTGGDLGVWALDMDWGGTDGSQACYDFSNNSTQTPWNMELPGALSVTMVDPLAVATAAPTTGAITWDIKGPASAGGVQGIVCGQPNYGFVIDGYPGQFHYYIAIDATIWLIVNYTDDKAGCIGVGNEIAPLQSKPALSMVYTASQKVFYLNANSQNAPLYIYGINGQRVSTLQPTHTGGYLKYVLNNSNLANGVYYAKSALQNIPAKSFAIMR
jgi:hypothetical protein